MSPAVWVPLLVAAILLLQVVIWVPIFVWLRRRSRRVTAAFEAELAATGERVIRGPESASYRGASAPGFSRVKGNCKITATDRRIVFRMLVGEGGEIALDRIVDVREDKVFLASRVGGQVHLVLTLREGGEVGFFVGDVKAWTTLLHTHWS